MKRIRTEIVFGGCPVPDHPVALAIYTLISAIGMVLLSFTLLYPTNVLDNIDNAGFHFGWCLLLVLIPGAVIVPVTCRIAVHVTHKSIGKDSVSAYHNLWALSILWIFVAIFGMLGITNLAEIYTEKVSETTCDRPPSPIEPCWQRI